MKSNINYINTEPKKCIVEALDNGFTSTTMSELAHGGEIQYFCNTGYNIKGAKTALCDDGLFDEVTPTCDPEPEKSCQAPESKDNTNYLPPVGEIKAGDYLIVQCEDGYELTSKQPRILCKIDGQFEKEIPLCTEKRKRIK